MGAADPAFTVSYSGLVNGPKSGQCNVPGL